MQLQSVSFIAAYGDYGRKVDINYMKGNYFHIFIDRRYYGQIIMMYGRWAVAPQHEEYFDTADRMELLDRVGLLAI